MLHNLIAAYRRRRAAARGIHYRSCNFCGGTAFRVFRRLEVPFPPRIYGDCELTYPEVGQTLRLQYLSCTHCGLTGVNPLTEFSDIDRHTFDGERNIVAWADIEYAAYERDKRFTTSRIYEEFVFESFRRTNRLLDVSCGPGVSIQWWRQEKGWNAEGIDPDRHSVRQAAERYGLTLSNGLIHDVAAGDDSFDLVVMDNSLEHTFDPLAALLKAYALLRPGGGLFIWVPNVDGLSCQHFQMNLHWGHWFMYAPQVLGTMLQRIGFEVTRVRGHQNPVNPAFAEKGIDISAYRDDLAVFLDTAEQVRLELPRRRLRSDFFNLMAVKPADAAGPSAQSPSLLELANASRVQRRAGEVTIQRD